MKPRIRLVSLGKYYAYRCIKEGFSYVGYSVTPETAFYSYLWANDIH